MKKFLVPLPGNKKDVQSSNLASSSTSARHSNNNILEPQPSTSKDTEITFSSESEDNQDQLTPTKKRMKKSYFHKYNPSWEKDDNFKAWIEPSNKSEHYFKCKLCDKNYIGGVAAVKKHNSSKNINQK